MLAYTPHILRLWSSLHLRTATPAFKINIEGASVLLSCKSVLLLLPQDDKLNCPVLDALETFANGPGHRGNFAGCMGQKIHISTGDSHLDKTGMLQRSCRCCSMREQQRTLKHAADAGLLTGEGGSHAGLALAQRHPHLSSLQLTRTSHPQVAASCRALFDPSLRF